MKKFHLKEFKGVTRVAIKTSKGMTMYIDSPTICIPEKGEGNYVIFGELKYGNLAGMPMKKEELA